MSSLKGQKNKKISIIYYDLQVGHLKVLHLKGHCSRFRKKGLNTKIALQGYLKPTTFQQIFFLHSPFVLDVKFA